MGKIKITLEDLFYLPGAEIFNPDAYKPLSLVEIDSRKAKKGSLFVAIKGDRYDGHDFISDALKKGASAVVIDSRKLKKFSFLEIPVITVPDTTKAYGEIANIWRKKITGKSYFNNREQRKDYCKRDGFGIARRKICSD